MSKGNCGWPSNPANPTNPDGDLAPLAPLAPLADGQSPPLRDNQGRFLTGNSGGGRRKGSRNRLTETFIAAIETDFAEYGPDTLAKLRADDPAAYLRIVASLVPRDLILKREQEPADFSEMSYDELGEIIQRERRNASIQGLIENAKK